MEAKMIEAEIKAKFISKQLHVTDIQNNRLLDFVAQEYPAYTKKTKSTRTNELVSIDHHKYLEASSLSHPRE